MVGACRSNSQIAVPWVRPADARRAPPLIPRGRCVVMPGLTFQGLDAPGGHVFGARTSSADRSSSGTSDRARPKPAAGSQPA